jgi:hypothetical protein
MNRIEIINSLIKKNGYKNYLEIGVQNGHCFSQIQCENKIGVDPDKGSKATVHKTSDDFFKDNDKKFDIIFIDGLHHKDAVLKDIDNSLKFLKEGGTIVMHDCLPTFKRMQEIPLQEQNEWTGNVWEAFLQYRRIAEGLEMCVVDCDWGCGIIKRGVQKTIDVSIDKINYENFVVNKKQWMNIISPEQFKVKYL